jgi:hypothetical protein
VHLAGTGFGDRVAQVDRYCVGGRGQSEAVPKDVVGVIVVDVVQNRPVIDEGLPDSWIRVITIRHEIFVLNEEHAGTRPGLRPLMSLGYRWLGGTAHRENYSGEHNRRHVAKPFTAVVET